MDGANTNRAPHPNGSATVSSGGLAAVPVAPRARVVSSDSEDDVPLASRIQAKPAPPALPVAARPRNPAAARATLDDPVALPTVRKPPALAKKPVVDSDSEEDVPLAQRKTQLVSSSAATAAKKATKKTPDQDSSKPTKRAGSFASLPEPAPKKRVKKETEDAAGGDVKWKTLRHSGVLFPPEYEPHGVKMLYDGVPVTLTPEQEEVASFYAVMLETDYMQKETFKRNFWDGFREVLGPKHAIKCLDKCDFRPMYEWHMAQREVKRNATKEEKAAAKAAREAQEAPYKVAYVDGRAEAVGNFRVEPPGLFRGRGEHPRMGRIKRRIYPRDITLNLGPGEPLPQHPYPDQSWAEVRQDPSVTWLAYWHDPINPKEFKYVFLAATSTWKAESDVAKYEKARRLATLIDGIRAAYTKGWSAPSARERQMTTALYFIDRLALRAGHEKDEDEADTVGCCTLKVENVACQPPSSVRFDFLGKDSIRYENVVEVDPAVYRNVKLFCVEDAKGGSKRPGDQLFDSFEAQDLNVRLKQLMDGLSVKVFRTYNASIVLDRLLARGEGAGGEEDPAGAEDVGEPPASGDSVDAKKAYYDRANKEVAVLCNHQRAVPRGHEGQMDKINDKIKALDDELAEIRADLRLANEGKPAKDGRKLNAEVLQGKLQRKKLQIEKAKVNAKVKEDLKTVALGTSKINYLDPRITVAWCKRNEVPLEKVFNRSLYQKFQWAMDVEPDFRF